MLDTDYAFHFEAGAAAWNDLAVVRFRFEDELSHPYRLRLVLHARASEPDPEELVAQLATLRMVTGTEPAVRSVHGLIGEAEELGPARHGMLYLLTLVPPVVRSSFRKRSRIFLEKSMRQIIEKVLCEDSRTTIGEPSSDLPMALRDDFVVPQAKLCWRIEDPSRLDDPTARPYVVQYEETDLAFVSRLCEEEGISYHFEHTLGAVAMVLSNHDGGRHRLEPFAPLGPAIGARELASIRLGKRLRPTKAKLTGFNWQKPSLDMATEHEAETGELFVVEHTGSYLDSPEQGAPLARALAEQLVSESRTAVLQGSARVLGAGTIFALEHPAAKYDGEYLVTRAICTGEALGELSPGELVAALGDDAGLGAGTGPFWAKVECVRRGTAASPAESKYRPRRRTPKPRILGSQPAIVTDEPGARGVEIHVGGPPGNENGCVRVRFHWDTETDRHDKEPTSAWVRVSQAFAGAGGGSVMHPRVGTEVIVEHLDGDPDRPIITGRVYNGEQVPPALGKGAATVSMMKSVSSPGAGTYNSFSFDDTAGKEKVDLYAGKDWNSEAGNNRTETVGSNSDSTVKANRTEKTLANRDTSVSGNNTETVAGSEEVSITGRQKLTITAGQDQSVAADRNLAISGPHTVSVGGGESYTVTGAQSVSVTGAKDEGIGASYKRSVAASTQENSSGPMEVNASAMYTLNTPLATVNGTITNVNSTTTTVSASAALTLTTTTLTAAGAASVSVGAPTITVSADGTLTLAGGGSSIELSGGGVTINGGAIKIAGGTVDITGGTVNVN